MRFVLTVSAFILFLFASRPAVAQELGSRLSPSQAERLTAITERVDAPFPGLIITPKEPRPVSDEKYNQRYGAWCVVYVEEKAGGQTQSWVRRFVVYAPDAQALPLARRVAKTLLLLQTLTRERLKTDHNRSQPTVHVWLTHTPGAGLSPDVGGEQFQNQIYLYDIYAERKPIEWLREIAHEYGHYALPAVAGFTAPEEWSNGVLGERLYLVWLLELGNREQGTGDRTPNSDFLPFVKKEELEAFAAKQVTPLIARWATETPNIKRLERTDAAGMDDYTGLILYWNAVYGSASVREVFASSSASQNGILTAPDVSAGALASLRDAAVSVITSPLQDKSAPFWIYLPNGAFSVEAKSAKSWQILPEGKPPITRNKLRPNDIFIKQRGWYKLKLTPNNDAVKPQFILKRIYTN
jgi:hypothetical protein